MTSQTDYVCKTFHFINWLYALPREVGGVRHCIFDLLSKKENPNHRESCYFLQNKFSFDKKLKIQKYLYCAIKNSRYVTNKGQNANNFCTKKDIERTNYWDMYLSNYSYSYRIFIIRVENKKWCLILRQNWFYIIWFVK